MNKIVLVLIMSLMFSLTLASAFEFDNIKTYSSIDKEVTLKNSFLGIPTTEIAKVKLDSPIHNLVQAGSDVKVADLTLNLSLDYSNLIKNIKFYDLNHNSLEINKAIKIKYLVLTNSVVNDYNYICNEIKEKNGTYNKCDSVVNGTKNIPIENWYDLDQTNVKASNYKIGLFTDVKVGERIEWVPNIAGIEVTEWADFVGYTLYNKFDVGDTTNQAVYNSQWECQSFKNNLQNLTLAGVSLRTYRVGSGATFNFTIRNALNSSGGTPTSIVAINDNYDTTPWGTSIGWNNITFTTNPVLVNNTIYFICGQSNVGATNYIRWGYNATSSFTSNNPMGAGIASADGGVSWALAGTGTYGAMYRIYGSPITVATTPLVTPTLNAPTNTLITNNTNIIFNFTITPSLANITSWNLSVWYNSNSTLYYFNNTKVFVSTNLTVINNNTYFPDDVFKWGVTATGNNSDGANNSTISSNYTFTIDTIKPNLLVNLPTGNVSTNILPLGIIFNITSNDTHLDKCYYTFYGNASLNPYTCNTNLNISFVAGGTYTVVVYANDTAGNINSTTIINTIYYTSSPLTFTPTVIEGEQDYFYYNVTSSGSSLNITNVTLVYNNVFYDMLAFSGTTTNTTSCGNGKSSKGGGCVIIQGGTNYTYPFFINISAPLVNSDTNFSLYAYYVANEASGNTVNNSQIVYNIPNLTISAGSSCTTRAFNFALYDEENLSLINGIFDYNFYYGLSNSSLVRTYGTITGVNNFSVCYNSTISNNWVLGGGEIQYRESTGAYVSRVYYLFSNMTFTNSTATTELKDLLTTSSTTFSFSIKDTSLNAYVGYYTALLRWYPNLNLYAVVDMGLTDDTGTAIMKVKAEDTDYRVAVYDIYGNLETLASPVRFVCQSAPCTYGLVVLPTSLESTDIIKVTGELEFNSTTKMVSYTYNDPTQNTASMNLSVWLYRPDVINTLVCNSVTTGITGVLTCNLSAYSTGTFYAVVQRSASPATYISNLWIELSSGISSLNPTIALFITLIILMLGLLIGAGTGNAIILVIFAVISLIPALALGAVPITFIIAIAIIGGVVIHYARKQ